MVEWKTQEKGTEELTLGSFIYWEWVPIKWCKFVRCRHSCLNNENGQIGQLYDCLACVFAYKSLSELGLEMLWQSKWLEWSNGHEDDQPLCGQLFSCLVVCLLYVMQWFKHWSGNLFEICWFDRHALSNVRKGWKERETCCNHNWKTNCLKTVQYELNFYLF